MLVPDLFENIGAGAVAALGLLASRQLQRFKENVAELKRRFDIEAAARISVDLFFQKFCLRLQLLPDLV